MCLHETANKTDYETFITKGHSCFNLFISSILDPSTRLAIDSGLEKI